MTEKRARFIELISMTWVQIADIAYSHFGPDFNASAFSNRRLVDFIIEYEFDRKYTASQLDRADRVLFPEYASKSFAQQIRDRDAAVADGLIEFDAAEGRYFPTDAYVNAFF